MKTFLILAILIYLPSCEVTINKDHVAEGTRLIQQGDYFNADLEFDDALFIDDENFDALRGSYVCALNLGNTSKALKRANKVIELTPDSSVGYNDRGTVFMARKQFDRALGDFNKVLELGTDYPSIAYFNRGEALRELHRDREAIVCYKVVIKNGRNDSRVYFKMGLSYKSLGVTDSACMNFKIANDLGDPDAAKEYSSSCN